LHAAGHHVIRLCEVEVAAQAVLRSRFHRVPLDGDIRCLDVLPKDADLVTAGFPCQDLSQVGNTNGLNGKNSSLVTEVFRLLKRTRFLWVLIENFPFMLPLHGGFDIRTIVPSLEPLGYKWAYRVIDTRAYGLPQRRRGFFFPASTTADPRRVL